ncbi:hypothetical protein ABZ341_18135 [Streptomyces sp. NPDC006173]|uniref:hypothetical protein n=1 Tax=Streptomyces sp. NPDC006173 TaxID=3155349 RepID=UPI0033F45F49
MTETTPAEPRPVWRDDNLQPADRLAAIRKRHAVLAAHTWEATPHQHGASGCRCLSCYDDPTGWQIDHPGALDCEELVATTSNDFGRKRGSCDAGPLLSYDEADALARAADDIGFLLGLAAATVPAFAPTDWIDGHPQLEAIAAAVWEKCGRSDSGSLVEDDPRNIAVAVLAAVLPVPADRAAVLREAADALPEADLRLVPPMDRKRVANWLRRLADAASGPGDAAGETQQDEPVRHAPGKAILCPDCRAKGYTVCMEPRVASQPTEPEATVAYQSTGGQLLRCLAHKPSRLSLELGCFHPVTSEGLPDGGLCTFQVSDTAVCGRDVLIAADGPRKACACGQDGCEYCDVEDEDEDKADELPGPEVVAYRNSDRPGVLLCREHGDGWWGLTPLTSDDLPDGGTCTYGDPADPNDVCGRDVLIEQQPTA